MGEKGGAMRKYQAEQASDPLGALGTSCHLLLLYLIFVRRRAARQLLPKRILRLLLMNLSFFL